MPGIKHIWAEIERMRIQVNRLRGAIKHLQRTRIPAVWAEMLSDRMLEKGRNRQIRPKGRCREVKWYDARATGITAILKTLAEIRKCEGWCYRHVQAIMLSIDQSAKTAMGNCEYFWNRPHGIGGLRKSDIPKCCGRRFNNATHVSFANDPLRHNPLQRISASCARSGISVVCGGRRRSGRLQLFHIRAMSGDRVRHRWLLSKPTRREE